MSDNDRYEAFYMPCYGDGHSTGPDDDPLVRICAMCRLLDHYGYHECKEKSEDTSASPKSMHKWRGP